MTGRTSESDKRMPRQNSIEVYEAYRLLDDGVAPDRVARAGAKLDRAHDIVSFDLGKTLDHIQKVMSDADSFVRAMTSSAAGADPRLGVDAGQPRRIVAQAQPTQDETGRLEPCRKEKCFQ